MAKVNFKNGQFHNMQLDNVKVWWEHLFELDTAFGKSEWNIRCHLEDQPKLCKAMKDVGLNVKDVIDGKNGDNPTPHKDTLMVSKKSITAKGKVQTPPKIVGPDGRTPWTEELGNGTVVNVQFSIVFYDSLGKFGVYLDAVQVVNHVVRNTGGFSDTTGGSSDVPF